MTVTTGFPRELLTRPSAERLAYFRAYTVAHPLLAEAKEKLMASISESEPNSLVFVLGRQASERQRSDSRSSKSSAMTFGLVWSRTAVGFR
jgi:hypothetical protein